jgi:nicotinamidase-related amidase
MYTKGDVRMNVELLVKDAGPFLSWLGGWQASLSVFDLAAVTQDPESVVVLSVDVTNGFCYEGPLSSPRVAAIVPAIVALFKRAHAQGVRHFILSQDTHHEEAVEFDSFAPHCTQGSAESEPVPEFKALPFFEKFIIMPKNSISSSIGTNLPAWLDAHPEANTFIVVGDCTDLCTYQLAMYLRLRANAFQRASDRVIVPVDCVDTYDVPVSVAEELGIFPHHGDLVHLIFLYSMALNGIEIVANVQ